MGDQRLRRYPFALRAEVLKDSDPLRAEAHVESYAPQGDSDFLRAEARERSYA